MKKISLMLFISIMLFSCEKDDYLIPTKDVPVWLKTKISQDELSIQQNPNKSASWGAWLRYKWQNEYYFEYHNIVSSSTVAPISVSGDTLYYGATNMTYYKEKSDKQYVWKGPNYIEFLK
jgi:hypothetical protein